MSLQWLGAAVRLAAPVALVGVLAIAGAFAYSLPAVAAQPYESGPVRQSHNPLSGENFQGGVEPSALENAANSKGGPVEAQNKGYLTNVKNAIQGLFSGRSDGDRPTMAPADLGTDKNPTFKRYGTGPQ